MKNKLDKGLEVVQVGAEVLASATDEGIPGVSTLIKTIKIGYNKSIQKKFESFCTVANVDEKLLKKLQTKENYSNIFFGILETIRRTHSNWGIVTLALIYKDFIDEPDILLPALESFAEINDTLLNAFIELYDSIPQDRNYLILLEKDENNDQVFHHLYNEAVQLINRNIFVQTASISAANNTAIQGMKWSQTDLYYEYIKKAEDYIKYNYQ